MNAGSPSLLLVDDGESTLEQFARDAALSESFLVRHCRSLEQGLQVLPRRRPPDAVLAAVPPECDPIDALRQFEALAPQAAVLFLLTTADDERGLELLRAGAQDVLVRDHVPADFLRRAILNAIERKRVRVAYRQLMDQAGDAIVSVTHRGRLLDANLRACQTLGYTRPELLELSARQIGTEFADEVFQALWKDLGRRPTATFPAVHFQRDGGEFPVEVCASRYQLDGRSFIVAIARDVTERALREQAERQLAVRSQQFELARRVQRRLAPDSDLQLAGFDVYGEAIPADETGGDFFDYIEMAEGHTLIAVGDVSGHGIAAALTTVAARAYLRAFAHTYTDLGQILKLVNRYLCIDTHAEQFATLFLLRLTPGSRAVMYAGAGERAYLFRASGAVELLDPHGLPLALEQSAEFLPSSPLEVEPGDVFLVPTDGVVEAFNDDRELFGTERMIAAVQANLFRPPSEILNQLVSAIREYQGTAKQHDDIAAVVAKAS